MPARASLGFGLAAAIVGLQCCLRVQAQIYTFDKVAIPEAKSLTTMYAFYVYSHQDAPDRSLGQPFVKFHGLEAEAVDVAKDVDMKSYTSMQLSILPYSEFWTLINPNKFCAKDESDPAASYHLLVQNGGKDEQDLHMYTHTIRFKDEAAHPKDVQVPVRLTGVYVLVFSNCGDFSSATVSGSVIVKNSYGFLPGNEYHKMPFYGWLSLAYVVLAVVWMALSLRWWRELISLQNCITVVIFLGLVEAFLWYMYFHDWNTSGTRGKFLFVVAILSSVVKSIFSYMLVLVASLGWGVTRPYLDHRIILKIQGISFLFIVLDFIRESVLSFRHSHTLSLAFVMLCLLPVSLLNGGIFYWIFTALSSLIETLKERRQTEKLLLYRRLWKLLVFSLAMASFTLLFQIFDLSRSITIRWKYQWFFADGVSHILFLLVLSVMMFLWAPQSNSQRYAFSQVDNKEEKAQGEDGDEKAAAVWSVEEGVEDEGDESFWATTHADGAAPVVIGSAELTSPA